MERIGDDRNMHVRIWNRISVRFGFAAVLICGAALLAIGLIIERQQDLQFAHQRIVEARSDASMITEVVTAGMTRGGGPAVWKALYEEAGRYAALTNAAGIVVFGLDGTVRVDTDGSFGQRITVASNPECPLCDSRDAVDFPATVMYEREGGRQFLRVINPIPHYKECRSCHHNNGPFLGMIAVDFNLAALQQSKRERQSLLLVLGLTTGTALIGMTAWAFRKLVMRPIKALTEATARMAAGRWDSRAAIVEHNEIGALALQFNSMADHIQRQFREIAMANTESQLFYTLVVEASKNLETTAMVRGVHNVLHEKLAPSSLAVMLEEADGHWVCMASGRDCAERIITGEGGVRAELTTQESRVFASTNEVPVSMINRAASSMELHALERDGLFTFTLPLAFNDILIGMVICVTSTRIDERLLNNLKAHLALAAGNSRNYTGAVTDPLTHLRNKRYGMARLHEAVLAANRYSTRLGLIMCDIDHFKRINDVHGHVLGDAVLQEVSRRIEESVRRSDIVVRYGGEEFMIIVPATSDNSLFSIGEKIRTSVCDSPVRVNGGQVDIHVTISVGAAELGAVTGDPGTLIEHADRALYRAKESGRNCVVVEVDDIVPLLANNRVSSRS